jgi:hypothetical protein
MKQTRNSLSHVSKTSTKRKPKLAMWAAVAVIAGSLTVSPVGLVGAASAQAATPTSVADCANWRSYGFQNRAACVSFVRSNNNNNGYGGGGNGGGGAIGAIGRLIANIFDAIARLFRAIFGLF